jgi:hypothetical protein
MDRLKALWSSLYWALLSVTAYPALALAQATNTGGSPGPGGGSVPAGSPGVPAGSADDGGWLWIVAALVVLALIWWAMSSRRRHGSVTR